METHRSAPTSPELFCRLETKYRDIADGNTKDLGGTMAVNDTLETKYRDIADGNPGKFANVMGKNKRWKPSTAI